jgi:hypothetical protein
MSLIMPIGSGTPTATLVGCPSTTAVVGFKLTVSVVAPGTDGVGLLGLLGFDGLAGLSGLLGLFGLFGSFGELGLPGWFGLPGVGVAAGPPPAQPTTEAKIESANALVRVLCWTMVLPSVQRHKGPHRIRRDRIGQPISQENRTAKIHLRSQSQFFAFP